MSKIGFIGLGIMGRPMARNLVKAGCDLVVSDLNKESVADVVSAGASEGTYREIGEQCDIIITMLPSGAIVQSVLFGENGVSSGLTALENATAAKQPSSLDLAMKPEPSRRK